MFDIDLNDLVFVGEPDGNDRIVTQNIAGLDTIYFRRNGRWGRNVRKKVKGVLKTVFTEDGTIPAGTGFWYKRTASGALKIRFDMAE